MAEEEVKKEVTTVSTTEPVPEKVVKTTTTVVPPPVKTEPPQQVFEKKKTIFRTYQVIWYVLAVIELLLGFRVALKALGADPHSIFANFIYTITIPLAVPFQGVVQPAISGTTSILEWSTLIAVVVYALVAYGLISLMQMSKPVTPKEVEQKVDNP